MRTSRRFAAAALRGRTVAAAMIMAGGSIATAAFAQAEMIPVEPKLTSPTGVNLFSGQYVYSQEDLTIGDLALVRSYGGGVQTRSKFFGPNWSHNFDIYVWERPTSPTRYSHVVIGGKSYTYFYGGFSPTQDTETGSQLSFSAGKYTFVDRSRTVYTFAAVAGNPRGTASWPVESVVSANGRKLSFLYDGTGKLKTVTSNMGYALVFDYGGNGYVSTACAYNLTETTVTVASSCAGAVTKTSYGYAGSGTALRLASAVDVTGQTSTISYDPNYTGYLRCVSQAGTGTCQVTTSYDYADMAGMNTLVVSSQAKAAGGTIGYSFYQPEPVPETNPNYPWMPGVDGSGSWTDEGGANWGASFQRGQPIDASDPRMDAYEAYEYYWTPTDISKVTYKEGNWVSWVIDGFGRRSEERRRDKGNNAGLDIVRTATFTTDCTASYTRYCMKPLSMTDGRSSVTDYSYDANHGGVLTETGPAVNGIRPQKRYAYQQRYAWISNGGGGYVQAASPVWLLTQESSCRTTAASGGGCAGGSADEVVTGYDYGPNSGPNTLLLRGMTVTADGQTLRTCYRYDRLGRRISETRPAANLATCS